MFQNEPLHHFIHRSSYMSTRPFDTFFILFKLHLASIYIDSSCRINVIYVKTLDIDGYNWRRRPLWNGFRFCEWAIATFRTYRLAKWLFKRHSCRAMVINNELEKFTQMKCIHNLTFKWTLYKFINVGHILRNAIS
jgi:hypothetical protein